MTSCKAEHSPHPSTLAECKAKSDDDNGEDAERLGHRAGEARQHLIEWTFPRKRLAAVGGCGMGRVGNGHEHRHDERGNQKR